MCAALAISLAPMFLGGGGSGINGILGNITGVFGNLISGVGNTISTLGGNPINQSNPVMPKTSNRKMYYMIGDVSFVVVLGTVVIIAKKK